MSVAAALLKAKGVFKERGVLEPDANAEFIMAEVLGIGRSAVVAGSSSPLSWKQENHFWELVKERARRRPLGYVLGHQPFCGLDFKINSGVLVPRPETENLVEEAVKIAETRFPKGTPLHIVDIGTGSGCIAVALAKNVQNAMIYATDLSDAALKLAQENAAKHAVVMKVRFLREDLFKPHAEGSPWADMVVSNPPYIPSGEIDSLEPEVLEEPRLALDGGKTGLEAITAIAADAPRILKPGGFLLMEFGFGQGPAVKKKLEALGFVEVELKNDLQGVERIVVARCGVRA